MKVLVVDETGRVHEHTFRCDLPPDSALRTALAALHAKGAEAERLKAGRLIRARPDPERPKSEPVPVPAEPAIPEVPPGNPPARRFAWTELVRILIDFVKGDIASLLVTLASLVCTAERVPKGSEPAHRRAPGDFT